MQRNLDTIAAKIFKKASFSDVSISDLNTFIEQNPYAPIGHLLLAKKNHMINNVVNAEAEKASLYSNDPLWVNYILQQVTKPVQADTPAASPKAQEEITDDAAPIQDTPPEVPAPEMKKDAEESKEPVSKTEDDHAPVLQPALATPATKPTQAEEEPLFEPYHTIDYFASQGIKLKLEDLEKDRFGKQLKSFTEWLKTMKKINPAEQVREKTSTAIDPAIEENATASVLSEDILTEAMAEVWVKQGNKQKAIQIYQKLSLQNPSKNGYFASKISQLNVS
jgi:hypothetical protein